MPRWPAVLAFVLFLGGTAVAQPRPDDEKTEPKPEEKKPEEPSWYSVHGQATIVGQGNGAFRSPYFGPNSLLSGPHYATTATTTLFLASKLPWSGGEFIFNPEVSGGVGISSSTGLGGYPNGEATRVGLPAPTPYFARAFYRQTFNLGGGTEEVADAMNQVATTRDKRRLVFQIGKMAATDSFDDNSFSHDPRTQFLNWSLMYNGAWDYPANVRGYTYGITAEWVYDDWTLTYGGFAEPSVANGAPIDPRFLRANGHALELERRYKIGDRDGAIRFMAFANNAHMGRYQNALSIQPVNPVVADTRAYRTKYGVGVNFEQELTETIGLFSRIGWNDGATESWAFTEIDHTVSAGLLIKGTNWCRPNDRVGVAFVMNGLSSDHRNYLAAGGIGFIVGDGRLNYGLESICETFYNLELKKGFNLTFDLQGVVNPGYNRDRGPALIAGVRFHMEF